MGEVAVITFGCRLNAAESEDIRVTAAAAGLTDAIIVNTCAVTAEAERQAGQAIRRSARDRPGVPIIVTGCAATLAPQRYAGLPGVERVLDNEAKLQAENYRWAGAAPTTASISETGAVQSTAAPNARRVRGYLQVQQGCDHRCTFCIIPYARGASRSLSPTAIIARARALIEQGCREIVLTGVDLTAYGADQPGMPGLGRMVRELLAAVPELSRLRLSSLDPSEIDAQLWALFESEPRLMPHVHLSLQAGDDIILKRMKRRHSRADAIAAARRARMARPEIALGADLIAGFPTETEEMFSRSLDLVAECGLTFVHAFPYSARPGTPAARMPQVASGAVRERARRLRETGSAALAADLARRVGTIDDVLIERPGRGRSDCYADVLCEDDSGAVGQVMRMKFAGVEGAALVGVPA